MPEDEEELKERCLAHTRRHHYILDKLEKDQLLHRIENQHSINRELVNAKYQEENPSDFWDHWRDESIDNFEQKYRLMDASSEHQILESLFAASISIHQLSDFKWKTLALALYDTSYSLLTRLIQNSEQGTVFHKNITKDNHEERRIKRYPEMFTAACRVIGGRGNKIIPTYKDELQPTPTFRESKRAVKNNLRIIRNDFIHNERDSVSFTVDGTIDTCFLAIPFVIIVGLSEFGLMKHFARCRFVSLMQWFNDSMLYAFSHYMVGKHQSLGTEHLPTDAQA